MLRDTTCGDVRKYIFNVRASYAQEARATLEFFKRKRRRARDEHTTLISFDQNDTYGQAGYDGLVAAYKEVIGDFPGDADPTTPIARFRYTRNDDTSVPAQAAAAEAYLADLLEQQTGTITVGVIMTDTYGAGDRVHHGAPRLAVRERRRADDADEGDAPEALLQQRVVRRSELAVRSPRRGRHVHDAERPDAVRDGVVVSQVVPNYQSDTSDVVTQYNALIAAKHGVAELHVARGLHRGARVHRRPARAHGAVHARQRSSTAFETLPDLGLGIGATQRLLADESPVLAVGVGHHRSRPTARSRTSTSGARASRSSSSSEGGTMSEDSETSRQVTVGRYLLHRQIARGGMATIHIARLMGDEGFSRIVAAKRLLPEFAEDTEFVAMFMDEARIASKVHHPNVVPVLDLVTTSDEVMLVQEYVHGVPLPRPAAHARHEASRRSRCASRCRSRAQVLAGLHAAHDDDRRDGRRRSTSSIATCRRRT